MPTKADRPGNRLMDRPEYASKPKPLTLKPSISVFDAVALMAEKNYGAGIVVDDDDKVIGVVTERDIMNKLVAENMDAKTTAVSAIMTENPRLARETDDLIEWLRIMSNERFRRLPVIDEEGRIKAVFTQGDFVSYTWPDLIYQMKAIATATVSKSWPIVIVGGGAVLYVLSILIVVGIMS